MIRRTFDVIRRNLPVFFGLSFLLSALPNLAAAWVQQQLPDTWAAVLGVGLGAWVVTMACGYALQAALIHGTVADLNVRSAAIGPGLALGLRYLFRLLWLAVFMGLAVSVGLILFIVPGAIMLAAWSVAVPVIVLEGKSLDQCLGRSGELTKGMRWPVFGLILSYTVASGVFSFGLDALGALAADGTGYERVVVATIGAVAAAVTSMVGAAGVAALYFELREAKDGVEPATVASVFD